MSHHFSGHLMLHALSAVGLLWDLLLPKAFEKKAATEPLILLVAVLDPGAESLSGATALCAASAAAAAAAAAADDDDNLAVVFFVVGDCWPIATAAVEVFLSFAGLLLPEAEK